MDSSYINDREIFTVCQAQELFILMFSLRGISFINLAYL